MSSLIKSGAMNRFPFSADFVTKSNSITPSAKLYSQNMLKLHLKKNFIKFIFYFISKNSKPSHYY